MLRPGEPLVEAVEERRVDVGEGEAVRGEEGRVHVVEHLAGSGSDEDHRALRRYGAILDHRLDDGRVRLRLPDRSHVGVEVVSDDDAGPCVAEVRIHRS